jgi:hypothetical protein
MERVEKMDTLKKGDGEACCLGSGAESVIPGKIPGKGVGAECGECEIVVQSLGKESGTEVGCGVGHEDSGASTLKKSAGCGAVGDSWSAIQPTLFTATEIAKSKKRVSKMMAGEREEERESLPTYTPPQEEQEP